MAASMRGTGQHCSRPPAILASWPPFSCHLCARFSLFQQKYKSLEGNSGFLLLDTQERQRLHSLLSISPTTIPEVSTASRHSTHEQVQVEGKVEEDIPENADVPRLRDPGAAYEEFLQRRRPAAVEDRPAVRQQEAGNPPL